MIHHGGALDAAIARHGGTMSDWMDLSTGINPSSYPLDAVLPMHWQRLPDAALFEACLLSARRYYGVAQDAEIVAAPGTQALIQILPDLLPVERVCVVSPSYGEHEYVWKKRGFNVEAIDAPRVPEGQRPGLVVVNPNNPDGRLFSRDTLTALADALSAKNGWMVIDEAFCDVAPYASLAAHGAPNVIILKSMGKFFGLAGMRLGFAIAPRVMREAMADRLGPWAVNGPALAIGEKALADDVWIAHMRHQLSASRQRLESTLYNAGFTLIGGTDLFVTVAHRNAVSIALALAHRHILVRTFDHHTEWLRFGLPDCNEAFDRLTDALETI